LVSARDLRAEEATPAAPPAPTPTPRIAAIRIAPEWGYRNFKDSEPSSTDKHYVASGFFALNARADVYPFYQRSDPLQNVGVFGSYGRAFGLQSTDIDTQPLPTEVDTTFYHFDAGLEYRLPSSSALSVTFSGAYERWVFDFDDPTPMPYREVATARYSLARAGADARWALGWVSLLGDAELMLPLSVGALGDREPTGTGFGARAKLGVAIDVLPMFTVDLSGAYTLVTFHLPSVPGRTDSAGSVLDQYLVASLGIALHL